MVVDEWENEALETAQKQAIVTSGLPFGTRLGVHVLPYRVNRTQDVNTKVRQLVQSGSVLVADGTCDGLPFLQDLSRSQEVPYVRLQTPTGFYMSAAINYLTMIKARDAVFIFQLESGYKQGLCYVLDNGVAVNLMLMHGKDKENLAKLKQLHPRRSHYVLFGSTFYVDSFLEKARENRLVLGESRWIALPHDDDFMAFSSNLSRVLWIQVSDDSLCALKGSPRCVCNEDRPRCHQVENIAEHYYRAVLSSLGQAVAKIPKGQVTLESLENVYLNMSYPFFMKNDSLISNPELTVWIRDITHGDYTSPYKVGKWTQELGFVMDDRQFDKLKKLPLRVGIVSSVPYLVPQTYRNGEIYYTGLCTDILNKLQEELLFDYELVFPSDGLVGIKDEDNYAWNGLMGMLERQDVDLAIGPISVTAERAQDVEFIVPYIDQTGISILGRKHLRRRSIFKFLEVLTTPVWWSILGAVVCVSLGLWLVELSSPFSSRYGAPGSRIFTLKESLWFAMTSFTPQGGGEVPKSLSGRVMVTTYWLFVVLILATFSANLAALLTVERMDTQISSLEQMAREPGFRFTAVEGTTTLEYFKNMASAEDTLYAAWKDMSLKTLNDYTKFRVWDYPIKEQYKKIYNGIMKTGPVATLEEGIKMVKDDREGRSALLTDVLTVRYLVNQDCDFIQIGDVFGEHPYAMAVPKGSALRRDISDNLMKLQKQRFFEDRLASYLDSEKRKVCDMELDTLGVYDLGGVFLALGIGVVIALVALVMESTGGARRRRKTKVQQVQQEPVPNPEPPNNEEQEQIFHVDQMVFQYNNHEVLENFLNAEIPPIELPVPRAPVTQASEKHVCKPEPGCLGLIGRPVQIPTVDW